MEFDSSWVESEIKSKRRSEEFKIALSYMIDTHSDEIKFSFAKLRSLGVSYQCAKKWLKLYRFKVRYKDFIVGDDERNRAELIKSLYLDNFPISIWDNKEICAKEAKKYFKKNEMKSESPQAYKAIIDNGWESDCFSHFKFKKRSLEECIEIASQYVSPSEWFYNDHASYEAARRNGWLEECKNYLSK